MNDLQKIQLAGFEAAKEIALTLPKNTSRRARVSELACNYTGCNLNGRFFVIGDSENDIQNSSIIIDGKPAREVFEGFSIMMG